MPWVFKSEPETWSWDQQVARGAQGEPWNGVRNHQANNFMKAMRVGDRGFFYHSGKERRIVGTVEVIKGHEPDPSDDTGKFGLVTIKAVAPLSHPVALTDIKAHPGLKELLLVRHSRISVSPVEEEAWSIIMGMSKP